MYKSGKAKKKIARLVDLTDENIEKRTEIIIEHFREVVMQELGGTAKAMVVTASRPAAVKYKLAFEKYISKHGYSDMACFVAFSGKVKLSEHPNKEYTEMGMNGISEKALPEAFDKDENRILLVANKYQTGFDQPRLCAMYVLKKLKKIAAVQTLSRLNRICPPYKKKTFILDFCNTYEDIKKSFAPYYTATILDNNITPSDIYKLETKLDGFGVLDEYDIDNFAELISIAKPTDRQKMQMTGYLQKAERRANNLSEENKNDFVANLKRFVRLYEFVIMASHFEDVQLHKKYKFCSNLQSWFKKDQSGEGFSLKDQIVANNFLNKLQGEYKKPDLIANPYVKLPEAETQLSEDEEKKLSEIIEEINNRTGNKFDKDVAAQAMLQIKEILLKSQKLQQSALVNSEEEFKFSYFDDIDDALVQGLEQNQDFFSMLLSNPEIKKQVLGVFVTEVYKTLKNKVDNIPMNHNVIPYNNGEGEAEQPMAAEDYECYRWDKANNEIVNLFGDSSTILLGCYKDKKHLTWIQEQNIYNIRLGARKGSMSGESELFERTSHLVLYDVDHPNKQMIFEIESCAEMSGAQLKEAGYPKEKPGKKYMTFKLVETSLNAQVLNGQSLIEQITKDHPEHLKGMAVFIEL